MKPTDNPFRVAKADDSTGFLLWQATAAWQRAIRKTLDPFGLTHTQFVLLASVQWLALQKRDVTQVLLAAHANMDPMTTSTVLRTLQAKGLLQRSEHAADTRAKSVALTEEGAQTAKRAVRAVEAFDAHFFAVLGEAQPAFNQLLATLRDQQKSRESPEASPGGHP